MPIQDEIPQSRITLTYRTTINGELEEVNLPFRMLVMGDFSLGSSTDRKLDLEERRLRSLDGRNLDHLMRDMQMSLGFEVPNRVDPDKEGTLQVSLPIDSMSSFSPDVVASHVPKVRALLLLKQLLQELQSNVDNRKELRKTLQELFASGDALKSVLNELKGYDSFTLPAKADPSKVVKDATATGTPAAGGAAAAGATSGAAAAKPAGGGSSGGAGGAAGGAGGTTPPAGSTPSGSTPAKS